ncbi:hypothetical protein [Acinetobacter sp. Ver3]|uniref:hypothetical protein n=1 Tax=Acinetobacter sp. Ver3 TaxID=466088 RepID=UPI00044B0948|nr:hypothetical protein [Acinetobacter sp. Ver3]EZQ12082.1 hypothetical protein CL42_02000 [Acinetobacter sp. Ver3]
MNESQTTDTTNVPTTEQTQAPVVDTTTTETPSADQNNQQQQAENNQVPTPVDVPESADAYSVEIDGFDFDAFKSGNAEVLKSFHAEGMTNAQVTAVVKAFDEHNAVQIEALQEEWGTDFNANVNLAKQAIEALGFQASDLDSPIGALKLAAAIGKQIQEDLPPSNTQQSGSETITQLMMSEAYSDANHPDHKSVTARINAYYEKQYQD